jgi:cytochrome c
MNQVFAAVAVSLLAMPAFAEGHLTATGDAEAGEKAFRQCVSCHVVVNEDGETLAGKKSKTGPNLYGIIGNKFGQVEGFKYSKINQAAADMDELIMDEATMVAYLADPSKFLQEATGEKGRSKMSYKVRKEEDALNLYAFLSSLQGAPE